MITFWTQQKPTVPGRYWFKRADGYVDICKVSQFDIDEDTFRYGSVCQWAGPLEEPKDAP